eukprot:ctg_838.g345
MYLAGTPVNHTGARDETFRVRRRGASPAPHRNVRAGSRRATVVGGEVVENVIRPTAIPHLAGVHAVELREQTGDDVVASRHRLYIENTVAEAGGSALLGAVVFGGYESEHRPQRFQLEARWRAIPPVRAVARRGVAPDDAAAPDRRVRTRRRDSIDTGNRRRSPGYRPGIAPGAADRSGRARSPRRDADRGTPAAIDPEQSESPQPLSHQGTDGGGRERPVLEMSPAAYPNGRAGADAPAPAAAAAASAARTAPAAAPRQRYIRGWARSHPAHPTAADRVARGRAGRAGVAAVPWRWADRPGRRALATTHPRRRHPRRAHTSAR